jgi:hypothetical protein
MHVAVVSTNDQFQKLLKELPDRKGLIKIISTRYFLVIKEINKYLVDMILINYFRSGFGLSIGVLFASNDRKTSAVN